MLTVKPKRDASSTASQMSSGLLQTLPQHAAVGHSTGLPSRTNAKQSTRPVAISGEPDGERATVAAEGKMA